MAKMLPESMKSKVVWTTNSLTELQEKMLDAIISGRDEDVYYTFVHDGEDNAWVTFHGVRNG